MRGWRVWYKDQSTYDSQSWDWSDIPSTGIIAVVVFEEYDYKPDHPYRTILSGNDWYYELFGEIHGVPSGDWGTWAEKPDISESLIKRGDGVSDLTYDIIMGKVMEDWKWP